MFQVLVINPGSTTTKIALYNDETEQHSHTFDHSTEDLHPFDSILDQYNFRCELVQDWLSNNNIDLQQIDAFVGRGGLVCPIPGGTYLVDEDLIHDLKTGIQGEHASNLGGLIAAYFARQTDKPAYIVDPVVVDELQDVARLSGHPALPRKSIFHALNQKAVARQVAADLGRAYHDLRLIVAHLGGGISIGAHCNGKVIDVNNALDGEGPYSPERSGTLPAGDLVRLCYSRSYSFKEITRFITGRGGLTAYLGTNDMETVEAQIAEPETRQKAELIYQGMAYQIAKAIGAMAAVLKGKVDVIVITGGISHNNKFVDTIKQYIDYIAPVVVIPGEKEMQALADGVLRILRDQESSKRYKESILDDNVV